MTIRSPYLILALSAFGCTAACSRLSPADRVKYGFQALRTACKVYEANADNVPRREQYDRVCLELAAPVDE